VMSKYRKSSCNNASTYTHDTTYSSNMDQVITNLFCNTPQSSWFNTSTHGQSPNQVYGLLQCIRNISIEKFSTCSQEENDSIQELCVDYRGTTRDINEIVVKKLSTRSTPGKKEFMIEVRLMDNFSALKSYPEKCRELDWKKCYIIILGITRGLLYLHEDSKTRIIQRDIKANNILLDNKFNPKIADFGQARVFPDDETHIQTRII
ncbi:hypothetical protein KI387_013897, partial [Taxus chinensis]